MLLRLFGSPALLSSASPDATVLLAPGKPVALLAYLACGAPRGTTREHVLDLLWAQSDPDRARQSLRQSLTQLRRVIGSDAIVTNGDTVRLGAKLTSDVALFEGAFAAGEPETALGWAGAPFLLPFATPGGGLFERWASIERARLDAAIGQAREAVARQHMAAGRFQQAREAARLARDTAADRESAWCLLLETLLTAGDPLGAALEATALQAWLIAEEREPAPVTRRLVARARRHAQDGLLEPQFDEAPQAEGVVPDGRTLPSPELVGREREFAWLLQAWTDARTRGFIHVHVSGPAGIGKSRLINDVRHRLRAAGVSVPIVRAHAAVRHVPAVLLADLVTALAHQRGALAVPAGCARTLVQLAPGLAHTYRGVATDRLVASGESAERDWLQAIEHLLVAVSEERPLVLVVDDVHWADDASTRVLRGACERLLARRADCRMLLVTAARDAKPSAVVAQSDDAHSTQDAIVLTPLTRLDAEVLLRSMAPLSDGPWSEALIDALFASSGGVPLVQLELLALLLERRLLRLDDEWRLGDMDDALDAIRELLVARGGPGVRVRALDAEARDALGLLAIAGAPLRTDAVAAALRWESPVIEAVLVALLQRGFVHRSDTGDWEPAHDEIRDAALAALPTTARHAIARGLGEHLLALATSEPDPTGARTRQAAGVLSLADADERLPVLFARWRGLRWSLRDRRSDAALAADLLGEPATSPRVRRLLAARPLGTRLGLWPPRPGRLTAATIALLLLGLGAGLGRAAAQRNLTVEPSVMPARLAVVTRPINWQVGLPMTPVPIVEVQDTHGYPVLAAGDSVHVEIFGDGAIVASPNAAPVVRGRATFDHVLLAMRSQRVTSPAIARFSYRGVAPIDVALTGMSESSMDRAVRLQLVSGTMNGQALAPERRVATAVSDEPLIVSLNLRYTSPWPAANVVLGAAPSWGDAARTWVRLASLVTPARDFLVHTDIRLAAPHRPGRYHIVLAFGAEENAAFLLSGTNWAVGRPIWHDGNDVAAWSDAQRAEADRTGSAPTAIVRVQGGGPMSGIASAATTRQLVSAVGRIGATTITVDVQGHAR